MRLRVLKYVYVGIVGLAVIGLSLAASVYLIAESLWFQDVGYLEEFWWRLATQIGSLAIAFTLSFLFLWGNISLATRLRYPNQIENLSIPKLAKLLNPSPALQNRSVPVVLSFRWLAPTILGLSGLVGLMTIYLAKTLGTSSDSASTDLSVRPTSILDVLYVFKTLLNLNLGEIGIGLGVATLTIFYPISSLRAIALFISGCLGVLFCQQWDKILLFFHPTLFNSTEPIFHQDISFYIFSLPVWEIGELSLAILCLYALVAVSFIYISSGNSLSEGKFIGFNHLQQRHLYLLGSGLMLAVSLHYWLSRYELLYSARGVIYGASYTNVNVELPVNTIIWVLALVLAIALLGRAYFGLTSPPHRQLLSLASRQPLFFLVSISTLFALSSLLPLIIQVLVVQPNELIKESPYIARTIQFTRQAFDLNNIDAETFNPQGKLTVADLKNNQPTIKNIRIWDDRPLLDANRQLQQIRPYYKFYSADIDRYSLPATTNQTIEKQQVIISARELDYSAVPEVAKTWVNEHLIYTHGYGFTLSPVNQVAPGGLPEYYVKDIGANGRGNRVGNLGVRPNLQDIIPTINPRIYFGELTNNHIMTGTKVKELDYPSGDDNVYNTYDGKSRISLDSWWRRCVYAAYLKDWQLLLTQEFTPQTQLLYRRNIQERVKAIAPWLQYDGDPYLVAANVPNFASTPSYLYWIIDAYTISDRYPYADPKPNKFNYIRNSVKVVIDAYNGTVKLYIADSKDPIIQSWKSIFPHLFQPLEKLPPELQTHLRYPIDLFAIQSRKLLTYHMLDPKVFYNQEDLWQIPQEIYGSEPQSVEPYYLIMKLPTASQEEFILLLPFTPTGRTNLIAWLAARSDGKQYGKLLLYNFPKQQLIYGTEQIEALINQDPVISQQISLWNRQGSRVIQGNLLVIPIESSLLYIEPIYLEAEQNSVPTLVRVVAAYQNRIVMENTLTQALESVLR
ncbi:UPF0182 family protein [Merismopedia glauca]|uniref:UPF0182 protein C7B64_21130 n=1 Tax=Merismopedia glauca CCAP 1448/3 TaxID=1296344 RepID=A0A2T1BYE9_9CYAN|nr:UPF0182 family protein [Merismopedia glauca]PSB00903.1 hypothetical protein C7B64_21130 [Merismopedia glauca CCAP 1448/3]